jgi:hypothetical protein
MLLYYWRAYMQAYVRFPEAEPGKHPIIVITRIGISGHLEVIGAFRPLRLFWTSCYVFVDLARPGFCRRCILRTSVLVPSMPTSELTTLQLITLIPRYAV